MKVGIGISRREQVLLRMIKWTILNIIRILRVSFIPRKFIILSKKVVKREKEMIV